MQKSCPSCGAEVIPGARFCRRCGAPMHAAGGDGTGDVSPQAATVPLNAEQEARTTDGLAPGEKTASADTSRVTRVEMERLLRTDQDGDEWKIPDLNATVASLNRDTLARDPEATLVNASTTRPDAPASADLEEELTVTVPRPARPLDTRETTTDFASTQAAPSTTLQRVTRDTPGFESSVATTSHETAPPAPQPHDGHPPNAQQPPRSQAVAARARRKWPVVVAVCVVVLIVAIAAAAWLAFRFLRKPALAELPTQSPTATAAPDVQQQLDEKIAQAEALLAQGNMDEAVARLREANALDPSNTRAHRRLGELLLASGARRDAIEEFRAVTRNAPEDFTAWRELATAQFAEGLYRDAADSYRHLVALVGEQSAEGGDLLSYADALRLSGRTDEARTIYQRLVASSSEDVAGPARQRLAELAQAAQAQHPGEQAEQQTTREGETASLTQPNTQPTPAATPTPAPKPTATPPPAASSPSEHYQRGVELWSSNRAAAFQEFQSAANGGNADANYYLGLYYVEGKDIHGLSRAALLAALRHFQLAQRGGGSHASEARRYEQQLDREFDRLRRP
jgi:tetratricopeptide (TPR) repeat protein